MRRFLSLSVAILCCALPAFGKTAPKKKGPELSADSQACYKCHAEKTRVIAQQWADSTHAAIGVGCFECHQAAASEPDAFEHYGKTIATIVTPKDCGTCHTAETEEFTQSHHAQAAQFIGSLDNVLGELAEGSLAAANGCQQCHGSTIRVLTDADGKPLKDEHGKPKIDPLIIRRSRSTTSRSTASPSTPASRRCTSTASRGWSARTTAPRPRARPAT